MIPDALTLSKVQTAFRQVEEKFSLLFDNDAIDLKGRRVSGAGVSISPRDYITRFEFDEILKIKTSTAMTVTQVPIVPGPLAAAKSIRHGTFSTRGAAAPHDRELFIATDLDYIGWYSTGGIWVYAFGVRSIAQSAISTFTANLGTNDGGTLINVTDFTHMLRWTGSATEYAPGDSGSGYIGLFPITPPGGTWGICDGTQYSYLKADGTTANFTTPDYSTAAYLKAGTSATIGPTAASGTTSSDSAGTPSGTVSQPTFTGNAASSVANTALGADNAVAHPYTPTGTVSQPTFTGSALAAHNHGPGTLELRRSQLIGYFRR